MRNYWFGIMFAAILLPAHTVYANDDMFNKMESKGVFGHIKFNMVVSCYTKKKINTKAVDLEQLKAQYPSRVEVCTCFEDELSKTSNRTVFDDSRHAYQLRQEKMKATQEHDVDKLKVIAEKEKAFKPFMTTIMEKCDLSK